MKSTYLYKYKGKSNVNVYDALIPCLILAAMATGILAFFKKKIRFLLIPLVFVLLLTGILGIVETSAKNHFLAKVETAMILGALETNNSTDQTTNPLSRYRNH